MNKVRVWLLNLQYWLPDLSTGSLWKMVGKNFFKKSAIDVTPPTVNLSQEHVRKYSMRIKSDHKLKAYAKRKKVKIC